MPIISEQKVLETSNLARNISIAHVSNIPIYGRKVKGQGQTNCLNVWIDAALFHFTMSKMFAGMRSALLRWGRIMQQRSTTWANVGNIGPLTFRLSGSFKVIRTNMNRSATYDFLLEIHRNHAPISYRDRDKRRFVWKMQINLLRLCLTPPLRVLLQNFVTLVRLQKTRMVALPDGENDM